MLSSTSLGLGGLLCGFSLCFLQGVLLGDPLAWSFLWFVLVFSRGTPPWGSLGFSWDPPGGLLYFFSSGVSTKALPFVLALPRCPRRLCLSFCIFRGVHEGSAFRFGPSKVSTKAPPFVLPLPRCPRRLCLSFWIFQGVHEGSGFKGGLSILLLVPFWRVLLVHPSGRFFQNENYFRIF